MVTRGSLFIFSQALLIGRGKDQLSYFRKKKKTTKTNQAKTKTKPKYWVIYRELYLESCTWKELESHEELRPYQAGDLLGLSTFWGLYFEVFLILTWI